MNKGKYKEDNEEDIAKRVIYSFVEIAKVIAPNKIWNPERIIEDFEGGLNDNEMPEDQLKFFIKSEFSKM